MSKAKRNRWELFTAPMTKEADEAFCSLVAAELRNGGIYADYMSALVHAGDLAKVVTVGVPKDIDINDYRAATQIQALFSKNSDLDAGFNPLKAAVEAAIAAELQCRRVNEYFGTTTCPYGGVAMALELSRRKIKWVLGKVPALDQLRFRLGPGASTTVKRKDACYETKLSAPLVCSEDMLPVVDKVLAECPPWAAEKAVLSSHDENGDYCTYNGVIIDTAKLIFVEKNAKTHRPICVEPLLNGFVQLGIGGYLKERLRILAKQDLRDQTRNQELARASSVSGRLATIDLSSASDTLAFSVVFGLLPEEWVDLLASFRTGSFEYSGHEYELEKFSSMGNGYTFELETLIFWAIADSCTELSGEDRDLVSVYGDDIIVPVKSVDLLTACLTWCGFNLNREKSYWSGNFRESCGSDWLAGEPVRPIYKKDRLSIQWLMTFHNWSFQRGYRALADIAKSFIPKDFQLYGPPGYGDGHLLGPWKVVHPRAHRRKGWEIGYFSTFREPPKSVHTDPGIAFLTGLYDLYANPSDWWDCKAPRIPGITPGTTGVEKHSIYTFIRRYTAW